MFGLSGTELAFLLVLILLVGAAWKLVRLFRSFWRRWARKDLRPGDLIALRGLTARDGRWSGPYPDRLQRLRGRGPASRRGAAPGIAPVAPPPARRGGIARHPPHPRRARPACTPSHSTNSPGMMKRSTQPSCAWSDVRPDDTMPPVCDDDARGC